MLEHMNPQADACFVGRRVLLLFEYDMTMRLFKTKRQYVFKDNFHAEAMGLLGVDKESYDILHDALFQREKIASRWTT